MGLRETQEVEGKDSVTEGGRVERERERGVWRGLWRREGPVGASTRDDHEGCQRGGSFTVRGEQAPGFGHEVGI